MAGEFLIVTGNGKGKTTYALALCLKAAGDGKKVFLGQFIKGSEYSEIKALRRFEDLITVQQFGAGRFIEKEPSHEDIQSARSGFEQIKTLLQSEDYHLIVLDEANVALRYHLFSEDDLLAAIEGRAAGVDVVLTGRDASPKLMQHADEIIEMREIKHYFHKGVPARVGIEK